MACSNLPGIHNGTVLYDPPQNVPSALLANEVRFTGTVARYNCISDHKLVNGSSQRVCSNGTWNGTEPSCQGTSMITTLQIVATVVSYQVVKHNVYLCSYP